MKINLITRDNGSGLSVDMALLKSMLEPRGHQVFYTPYDNGEMPPGAFDLNIFLELFTVVHLSSARRNAGFFNQEWFLVDWLSGLSKLDAIFCKTRHAEEIFRHWGNTVYTGFTSRDMYRPGIARVPEFLHLRGKSRTKGTLEALHAWKLAPSLPTLHVYYNREFGKEEMEKMHSDELFSLPNVKFHKKYLSVDEVAEVYNKYLFHVCPSPMEGFGHYINEGKSVGAYIITTAAPPMNEIIYNHVTGRLVSVARQEPHHAGMAYYACPKSLAEACLEAAKETQESLSDMSKFSRNDFLRNDAEARHRIIEEIEKFAE